MGEAIGQVLPLAVGVAISPVPIIAVILEWLIFGIYPTWVTALGIAITCAGVALVALKLRSKSALQEAEVPGATT